MQAFATMQIEQSRVRAGHACLKPAARSGGERAAADPDLVRRV
jgi:hypothetical protein